MVEIPPELLAKLSPELIQQLQDPGSPIRVLVEFFDLPTTGLESMFRENFQAEVTFRSTTSPQMSMQVDEEQVPRIAAMGLVKKIHHVPTVSLQAQEVSPGALEVLTLQETQAFIRVPDLKRFGGRGSGLRVGIVDSGVDRQHPMLQGAVVEEKAFLGEPGDIVGHGTWVAGCAAGRRWEERGVEGVAPEADIVSAKIFDTGDTTIDVAMAGLEWAASRCHVVNGSWGGPPFQPLVDLLIRLKRKFGTAFVFAAGNGGVEAFGYPGGYREVAAVGSVSVRKPAENEIADFSSRGPALGGIKPDVVAPGGSEAECIQGPAPGGGVACFRGTSMSTPHITGLSLLLLPVMEGGEQSLQSVYNGAVDLGLPGKDNDSGHGKADGVNALVAGGKKKPSPGLITTLVGGAALGVAGLIGLTR